MATIYRIEDKTGVGPYRSYHPANFDLIGACRCSINGVEHTPLIQAEAPASELPASKSYFYFACPNWEALLKWWGCEGYKEALVRGKGVWRFAKYEVPDRYVLVETTRQVLYNRNHAKLVASRPITTLADFDVPL